MSQMKRQIERAAEAEARRPVTLADLSAEGVDVFCWCNRCGHNATSATRLLIAQLGPAMAVPEIGARMRCSSCGSKDVATRPAWPSLGMVTHH